MQAPLEGIRVGPCVMQRFGNLRSFMAWARPATPDQALFAPLAEPHSSRRRQADVTEADVTPEMTNAGTAALWAAGLVEEQLDSDAAAFEKIFRAMWDHRPRRGRARTR